MAIVCLASASGSPGVTTAAVGMAFSWPRPVLLVEADPTGGSGVLPGFLRGTTPYDAGLIELALSPLGTADALRDVVRPLSPNVSLVAGIRSHAQATALRDVWDPLVAALRDLDDSGQDVIVDGGRLGLVGSPTAVARRRRRDPAGHPGDAAVDLGSSFVGGDRQAARDWMASPRLASCR